MDSKQWQNQTPFLPLGTIYAASLLRNNNFDVSLFDVGLKNSPNQIIPVLNNQKPDVLVIYDDGFNYLTKMCLTNMRNAAFKMMQLAKQKGVTVIVSSSDATDHSELYLQNGADYVLFGEAEFTLLELIETLKDNGDLSKVNGVIFIDSNFKIHKTKPRKVLKSLDDLPFPAWDLIDVEAYKNIWKNSNQTFTLNLATTRGCPYHCNWCAKPIYGQRYNSHSPKRVVEMIKYLSDNYQVNRFWMCDDIFGLKPNWVQQFNELLKQKKLNISYYIQSRADLLLKEDTIDVLAESGLEEVWIGAESGSQKILDAMDKGTTIIQIKEATKLLYKKNIRVAFFIQYGYIGETKEDIQKTIALIKELKPDNIGVSVSYPLPETPFYAKVKHQFKDKTNWKDSDDLALLFKTTFNQDYYRKLQRYTHKVFRIALGIKNLKKLQKKPFKQTLTQLKSIVKLIYYIPSSILDKMKLNKMENTSRQ
jgi:anaerobic magnesium-protoporphyrin IX monomethyl ester cyclase